MITCTEAEWEYAAGGGPQSKSYKYAGSKDMYEVGWYYGNSWDKTHPVGTKSPNKLDLYNMSGNGWEWCEDYLHNNYNGAPTDGQAWIDSPRASDRVYRSGSWNNNPRNCRVANRNNNSSDKRNNNVGFRLSNMLMPE